MVASEVDFGDQRGREEHHQQRRLGEKADQHLAARAERAEGGADVHRRQRDEHPGQREQPDQRDRVGRRRERQVGRQRRDDRAGEQHAAEDDVGRGAEQRRGVVREHRLLVEQLVQQPVRLQQPRRRPVLQPGAALVDPADQQRREQRARARSRAAGEMAAEKLIACTSSSSADQRQEAVEQVDRDAALLQQRRPAATAARRSGDGQVEPVPELVVDDDAVARLAVEGRRQLALHAKERLEDLADRLAEALGRVLHARGLPREAAVPGRRAAEAPVVEAAHQHERPARSSPPGRAGRSPGRSSRARVDRREQPAAGGHGLAQAGRDELARDRVDQLDELDREQAERDAAARQPDQADALPGPGVVGVRQAAPRAAGRGR